MLKSKANIENIKYCSRNKNVLNRDEDELYVTNGGLQNFQSKYTLEEDFRGGE